MMLNGDGGRGRGGGGKRPYRVTVTDAFTEVEPDSKSVVVTDTSLLNMRMTETSLLNHHESCQAWSR